MPKFTRNTAILLASAAALIVAVPASANIVKDILAPDASAASEIKSPSSLSAAKYGTPVCFSAQTDKLDSVVSLHKERGGTIVGKTFGAKYAVNKDYLQSFGQEVVGEYVSNHKIGAVITTTFEDSEMKRTGTIVDYGKAIEFGSETYNVGDCTTLVHDYLERDIERRRGEELAQKFAFNEQLFE